MCEGGGWHLWLVRVCEGGWWVGGGWHLWLVRVCEGGW